MGMMPVVERIAREAEPNVEHDVRPSSGSQFGRAQDVALRIRGLLEQQDDLQSILGPIGPAITAAGLHPWVWNQASCLVGQRSSSRKPFRQLLRTSRYN